MAKSFFATDPSETNLEGLATNECDALRKNFQSPRINKELKYLIKLLNEGGAFDVEHPAIKLNGSH